VRKLMGSMNLAKEELQFAREVDEVVCVSEKDAAALRMFCHAKKVCALETAISTIEFSDAFEHTHEYIAPELKQPIVLYIAYFGSETNITALKWYLNHVHFLISNALPEYKLHVVGRGDLSSFREYPSDNIKFIGEVPRLAPYIKEAKIGIAPALNGGGFRGKINQYSIYGVPVVASKIAARGLAYRDGHDIFIADNANLFAKQCIRLLRENDLNEEMGVRAREKAIARYTWGSKLNVIKKIYDLGVD
jgi:glycosyltransferase involved in cell wall biosynthesis